MSKLIRDGGKILRKYSCYRKIISGLYEGACFDHCCTHPLLLSWVVGVRVTERKGNVASLTNNSTPTHLECFLTKSPRGLVELKWSHFTI